MSKTTPPPRLFRIGQVAQRTGLSAKALRLYEAKGLIRATTHSAAGYRLYGPEALRRLVQVAVLRRSGFTLAEIGRLLERDPEVASRVLAERIAALQRDLAARGAALAALQRVARQVEPRGTLDVDQLLESIAMTQHLDVEFTPAQREALRLSAEALGEQGMAEAQRAWPELIAQVRAAMDAGTPPADPAVIELARRWHALVQAFTGGDPGIAGRLRDAYREQPQAMAAQGLDPAMFAHVGAALAAAGIRRE